MHDAKHSNEGAGAALVLALGIAIMALTARGRGPTTPGRLLSAVLSNPIPGHTPRHVSGRLQPARKGRLDVRDREGVAA
jgi:hypothetical protein